MQKHINNEITVVILSNNEEDVIERSVKSGRLLSKSVLVIDSGSSDNTIKKARKLGARVILHPFKDFSDQRNFALKQITTPWVFFLDADEELTEEIIEEINLLTKAGAVSDAGYFVRRKTFYYGKDWGMSDRVQRFFRTENLKRWEGVVHETPIIDGTVGELKEEILHYTHRDLSQMVRKTNKWSDYEARLRFDVKHPKMNPIRFMRIMATGFLKSYIREKGYKNGTYGLIEAMYQAFSMFITYAKLWELQEKNKKS